jgi:hypothetical protein
MVLKGGVIDGNVVKVTQAITASAPTFAFVDVHELQVRVLLPGDAHTEPPHATEAYQHRKRGVTNGIRLLFEWKL